MGCTQADYAGKPVIAIVNTWGDINPCHSHLRERAEDVKRGVWQAGGWPLEFPTISLGEFNIGQQLVARTMRPVLDTLLIESHTLTRLDEMEFVLDRSITQAIATQAPCCFILSPLLTGGKVFSK